MSGFNRERLAKEQHARRLFALARTELGTDGRGGGARTEVAPAAMRGTIKVMGEDVRKMVEEWKRKRKTA